MNRRSFLSTLAGGIVLAGSGSCTDSIVSADSLIANIDKYVNRRVKTEGFIAHICGVDGKKMKLMSDSGEVIVILARDNINFDTSLYEKRIRVSGLVKEERLDKKYIDEQEKEKAILCHVDQRPCKDIQWVQAKVEAGVADSLSQKGIEKLRQKMAQQGRDYVSIVSIVCEQYEVIG